MEIRNADHASKAGSTPFDGWMLGATPVMTFVRGERVMEAGRIVGMPRGRFVSPE